MKQGKLNAVNIVGVVALLVIIISVASLGMRLTGRVSDTSTAVVNVTIGSTASINFTDAFIDFGGGVVDAGQSNATLESNDTTSTNGNWSWTADYFTLENNGNANLSVQLASGSDADTYLGGSSPAFQYAVINGETDSCSGGDITLGAWTNVNVTDNGTEICGGMGFEATKDLVNISVRIVVPSDAGTGTKTATFTATGTTV